MTEANVATSLDPPDWREIRCDGHRMLDDMFDHLETLRDQPVWRAPSQASLGDIREPMPRQPAPLRDVHAQFMRSILPFSSGNAHPGFMGWVQGGGTPVGMLAEMLAAGMNANLGGRHHMPIELERQMLDWIRDMFGFPATATGLFVTGTSMANLLGVLIARTRMLGVSVRSRGLVASGRRLTAYASAAAHGCIARAMEIVGFGRDQLRLIPTDAEHRIQIAALRIAIAADRANGDEPFLLIGTAGTVDVGATDDLQTLADIAAESRMHFHIDGAFGALAILAPELAANLAGIERADSLAFDWHKWGQVPYDAGYLLVRDGELHRQTFAADAAYLRRAERGLAGGDWWPCDYGLDLSRGFRALKTWFTLKTLGTDAIGNSIKQTVSLARHLADLVIAEPRLELLAPVPLNIVCFGVRGIDACQRNAEIVAELHEAGRVAPSLTAIGGRTAIRAAIVNHRTTFEDIVALVDSVLAFDSSSCEGSSRNSNSTRAFTMAGVFAGIAAEPVAGDC
jgi:aromatic-L-amino-acid/L-tryptophan decarboxylase